MGIVMAQELPVLHPHSGNREMSSGVQSSFHSAWQPVECCCLRLGCLHVSVNRGTPLQRYPEVCLWMVLYPKIGVDLTVSVNSPRPSSSKEVKEDTGGKKPEVESEAETT